MAYEASSVASALAPWSAVMLASRLASCAATKASVARPSRAFAIFVSTSSGVSNPSTVESREGALASALPRRAASRAAVVTAFRRAAAILEPVARGAIAGASALLSSFEASSVVQGLDGRCVVAGGCRVHRQVRYLSVRRESQGQLPRGDVRAVSHLSVVQDLRDVAGNRSFKHVYICSRRLSPAAKAAAKELSASYSARGLIPAASAVEYHSVRSEKFPCNPRDSGVVCLTQQPLTG